MSANAPSPPTIQLPQGLSVAVVAARFNAAITDRLLEACVSRLQELGIEKVEIYRVPGAYELPLAAKWCVESDRFVAVVAVGCVIRGDTPHFEYVSDAASVGLREAGLASGVPVIFGVLTVNTDAQAEARTPAAGISAAEAACEMIMLRRTISAHQNDGPH